MIILTGLLFFTASCSQSEPAASSDTAKAPAAAPAVDLSVPPPGSSADQAKWDSFTAEKKQESWDKYLASLEAAAPDSAAAEAAPVEEKKPGSRASVVAVAVGKLTRAPMEVFYYNLGELRAGGEMRINPQSTGIVASLYVREGDFVEPGDLLFSLDNNDLVKSMERTSEKWNTDLELAEIKLNEALENYETTNSLYAKELVSRSEFEKAKQAYDEAQLNFEKTQLGKTSELENLQENLRTTLAISPGRGYVSEISFSRGETVNSADYVEIIDIEKIAVSIRVPENIITRVKPGQQVFAKKASAPDYVLEGTVSFVGLKADSNRSYEVVAEFDNSSQKLLPGMLIEAQIKLMQYSPNFVVPKSSVVMESAGQFIFRIKDNAAEKVPVELGRTRGELIQVSGPLKEGDVFVLSGQTYLQKGTSVTVSEEREYLPARAEL